MIAAPHAIVRHVRDGGFRAGHAGVRAAGPGGIAWIVADGAGPGGVAVGNGRTAEDAGRELIAAIRRTHDDLVRRHALRAGGQGNDISEIVERFIPPGTSCGEARKVLAGAGFDVSPVPAATFMENSTRMDRPAVTATIPNLASVFAVKVEVIVNLYPRDINEYDTVGRTTAFIFVSTL